MTDLGSRIREIELKISKAARRSGRTAEAVALMAVTKTRSPVEIQDAWDAGIRLFGENRVQEEALKIENWPRECVSTDSKKAAWRSKVFCCLRSAFILDI